MRRGNNIFWGVMFLVFGAFIIAGAMGVFGGIGFWTIFFTPFLVVWLVKSVIKLAWGGMLFSLAFLAILYDKMLGIENLTPWPVLLAALFGTIGLNIIFGRRGYRFRRKWKGTDGVEVTGIEDKGMDGHLFGSSCEDISEDEHNVSCDVSFSSVTKYISSRALRNVSIDNSFATLIVYFDGAILENGKANVSVDTSFGSVVLYIPKQWRVVENIDKSFGSCRMYGNCAAESDNVLHLNGDVSFGSMEIHYI